MPVSDEHALRQFEIEALRQITDNLRRMNDRLDRQAESQAEQGKVLHSIDSRLIRIESNKLEPTVEKLQQDVEELKQDKDRRDGALGLAQRLPSSVPWLLTVISACAALVAWLKAT